MPEMHRFYPICPLFSPVKNGPHPFLALLRTCLKSVERSLEIDAKNVKHLPRDSNAKKMEAFRVA